MHLLLDLTSPGSVKLLVIPKHILRVNQQSATLSTLLSLWDGLERWLCARVESLLMFTLDLVWNVLTLASTQHRHPLLTQNL